MRLPEPLRRLRSAIAGAIGLVLRMAEPVLLRLRRFRFECTARAQLRGKVAAGVQFVGPVVVEGEGLVDIGRDVRIGRNVMFETYNGARIRIAPRVTINDGVVICAYYGVSIGEDSMVGEYASIRDANHGTAPNVPIRDQHHTGSPIVIERDCWVGRGSIVLRGVTMHSGSVAAANSVVNQDIPSGVIMGGVPARPIGHRA